MAFLDIFSHHIPHILIPLTAYMPTTPFYSFYKPTFNIIAIFKPKNTPLIVKKCF